MQRYDTDPMTAEAELRRASDEVGRVDDDLDNAREIHDRLEQQWHGEESEDEKSSIWSAMDVVEKEIEGLEQDLQEANDELSRLNDFWFEEIDEAD